MSEPADAPQPEPEPYPWRAPADCDADAIAVLVAALLLDFDAAVSILSTLDDEQTVSLCWCLARWHATELALDFADPVEMLRGLALILARGRGSAA